MTEIKLPTKDSSEEDHRYSMEKLEDQDEVEEDVTSIILTLQRSYKEELIIPSLCKIRDNMTNDNTIQSLIKHNVHKLILSVLQNMSTVEDIVKIGLELMNTLVERDPSVLKDIQNSEAYKVLLKAVHDNPTEETVQIMGLQCFEKLLESEEVRNNIIVDDLITDIRDVVLVAMGIFQKNGIIQKHGCHILVGLLDEDFELMDAFTEERLGEILTILNNHISDEELLPSILQLLECIAHSDEHRSVLVSNSLDKIAVEMISSMKDHLSVIEMTCGLLVQLQQEGLVCKMLQDSNFLSESLVPLMVQYPDTASIQRAGLDEFCIFCENIFARTSEEEDTSLSQMWCNLIFQAMLRFLNVKDIQILCCKAVSVLMKVCPDAHGQIGDHMMSGIPQVPLHSLCLGDILMHKKDSNVFSWACEAMYWMAANNERICDNLMDRNAHLAVLDGISRHFSVPFAVECGLRAIRGIIIFHNANKCKLIMDGIQRKLAQVFVRYTNAADVLIECVSTIACLGDIEFYCNQCLIENVHKKILASLEKFSDHELLQEAGLECLCVLSTADKASEILNSCGALNHVIKTMELFQKILYIQRKGLVLIQMLCEENITTDLALCTRLARVLCEAISTYPSQVGLLKEACVAVQLWSELSHYMCEEFVNVGCHQLMFDMLADHIDQELLNLAGECLVIFGLNDNVKSNMLWAECKRGNLAGVECLLDMDGDVNFGHLEQSPLCCAVMNQNEDIVRLLLGKGMNDIKTAIRISLQTGNNTITGLLLHALCYNRDSYHIPWSGLGLGAAELSPLWFTITMPRRLSRDDSSCLSNVASSVFEASGKYISSLVKGSEVKRKKRQNSQFHPSKSDSNLYPTPRHKFRYHFNQSREDLTEDNDESSDSLKIRVSQLPQLSPINSPQNSRRDNEHPFQNKKPPVFQLNSTDDEDEEKNRYLVFESSYAEGQEWKQISLTGAALPYSQLDPRVQTSKQRTLSSMTGPWMRKLRSPSPSSNNLELMGEEPTAERRLSSTPVVSSDGESSDVGKSAFRSRIDSNDSTLSGGDIDTRSERSTSDATNLITLDLSVNGLNNLNGLMDAKMSLLDYFSSIEKLYLNDNALTSLPAEFFVDLTCITVVELHKNRLTEFPVEILQNCDKLSSLNLSNNKITTLIFSRSEKLTELNVGHNLITDLPMKLGKWFPLLEILQLNRNRLESLDKTDSLELPCLKKLELSHNELKEIPETFLCGCPQLQILEMAYNNIEKLPSENVSQMLPKLSRLKLRNNRIYGKEPLFIPNFILELQNLKFIDLCENNLTGLPVPPSWKSTMLKEVLVSRNKITKISLEGGRAWAKLESLHLAGNGIHEIPPDIGMLTSLTSLDISQNPLTTLPDELGKCLKMWELPLHGLNLDLDRGLVKGKVKDLIMYLHNRLKRATEYYRMKMMVIGYAGRGKSTLLQALMKKYNKSKDANQATVGVIVEDWKFTRWRESKGNVTYTLSTWDFAGQEEFYSTHQCYLSNRALYLVVCNLKEGLGEIDLLKPWLCNIQARSPNCPVIVVMTHLDKIPEDKRLELVESMTEKLRLVASKSGFPDIKLCVPVICTKENQSIEYLRTVIKDIVDEYKVRGQPVMGQKVPASYVKLADLLAEVRRSEKSFPVIKHNQLLKIVQEEALDLDEEELEQAVKFLHECGVLLHYPDKALNLKDLYFIDPGWLCRMMAQIVTVRQINPFIKNGIMRKSDVNLLFTGKRVENFVFPKDLIPQYLRLLEKFEIALPHSENELLIPCHLPERKPQLNMPDLPKDEKIIRYYEMSYVPLGMWSRLITRLIIFSKSQVTEVLVGETGHCPTLTYWNKGIFMYWNQDTFCLVDTEGLSANKDDIVITVPVSGQGQMILGLVVDHIDGLIEEWYPGLTTLDPLHGHELLEKYAPCFMCSSDPPNFFKVDDLLSHSESAVDVECESCGYLVPLSKLAPDIVMSDLHPSLICTKLVFEESAVNLLGDGGFGNVYKTEYKGQAAAVKIFSAIGDIHPHKMLRQEVTILRCLNHPSVVSLLGVSIQPRAIILELAPLGSLSMILRNSKLIIDRMIQHRIALQVTEGLAYLHKLLIVYRDMKPDNVLIFSDSLSEMVNAKISDYGISRFSTPDGLMAQEGTPAYRAPEVIHGETYSFKADVFSLGITLYALVSGGRHPYDDHDFKSEMDRAIAEGSRPQPITQKGCLPWPNMQTILSNCMQLSPDKRPHSIEVWEKLKNPEVLGLKRIIPISKGTTVECFTIQEQDGGKVYLWVASGDCDYVQLSRLDLMDHTSEVKGAMFRYGRILSLLPISQGFLLVGTQMCRIWLYDTLRHEYLHCTNLLPDAVLCMRGIHLSRKDDTMIFAGLANGTLAIFPQSEILYESNTNPMCISPGKKSEAVRCLEVESRGKRMYCSCGSKIVLFSTVRGIAMEKVIETKKEGRSVPIYSLCVSKSNLYVSHKGSSIIQVWEIGKERIRNTIDVSQLLGIKSTQCRITSLVLQDGHSLKEMHHGILWVGMGDGRLTLIDSKTEKVITSTHCYSGAIRTLKYIHSKSKDKFCGILSGGFGFYDEHGSIPKQDRDDECGCVAIWHHEFGKISKDLADDIKRRCNFVELSQQQELNKPSADWGKVSHHLTAAKDCHGNQTENEMFDSL